jgi:RHS repeat-associated protein
MQLLAEKSRLGEKVVVRRMRRRRINRSCGLHWRNHKHSRRSSYGRVLYNYYRTYDPSTGRYLESDPVGLNGGLNTYGYAYQNPLYYYDPTGEFGIAGAIGGIVSGYLLSKLTGCDYSFSDVLVDGALGAAGAGLASKLNKLNRIRKLRELAQQRGMQSTGRRGYTESYRGPNGERLNIKHRGASSPGLQQGSYRPRFDYRTRPGTSNSPAQYRDPFTGRTGPKGDLSHVPLEPPLGNAAAGAAGAAGGAASEAGENAVSECECQ